MKLTILGHLSVVFMLVTLQWVIHRFIQGQVEPPNIPIIVSYWFFILPTITVYFAGWFLINNVLSTKKEEVLSR